MPGPAHKRLSFPAPDYGLLYNLTSRFIPISCIILLGILLCVVLAYSVNGRAVPRQYVVGTYVTLGILVALWTILSAIYCSRPKCAGKHNLRLEPAAKPVPVPEMAAPEWDGMGPGGFYDRPKQAPAAMRQGRDSTALGDLYDQIKHVIKVWADKHHPYRHDRDGVEAPMHASRERGRPAGRHAPHNQRGDTAEREGMLTRWRRSYSYLSGSGMTDAEAEDLYRRQRDRDNRGARDRPQCPHQAHCETDDKRSRDSNNTEVEPPRAVLGHDMHCCKISPPYVERC
ncbi:hypothetical protein VE03_02181 [Pseudogymnoascus sp. 23342-1-I1]|nr:hypothetical protein VE03_02181 [Pseudogymnoascus sp. 23342-1-I1]